LEQTPDLYLYEIKERLEDVYGANYTESTISQTLERRGWTRKKVTRPSQEATEEARNQYLMQIAEMEPSMIFFLDESHTN
ncbi:hypothetical protein GG344DRAFT_14237, partial [Lentinula edodes]